MPLETELRSRAEEAPLWEDLEAQNERLHQLNSDFFEGVDREIRDRIELYQRECWILSQEIEAAGTQTQLERDNPTNLAINTFESSLSSEASERSRRFDKQCDVLFAEPSETIEGMPLLRRQVVAAHDLLAPSGEQGFRGARLVLSLSLGLALVAGLSALLDSFSRTGSPTTEERPKASDDTLPELNRRAELASLLLQAAANRPVDASRYGVTSERLHALRAAVLAMVQELPEQQYWEQLALAAEAGYGADGAAYTLGDHFYALDLVFALLEPLVDAQPCDLDLEAWLSALGQQWQEGEAQGPGRGVPRLYRSLAELVPDDSGATRLMRVFLARAALAQVALQQEGSGVGRPSASYQRQLKGSISSAFFQVSGAAMFCLPPPFMAYGYLANTVLEVFFGGSGGGDEFFDALGTVIQSMKSGIEVIANRQMLDDINAVKEKINHYSQALENKWNSVQKDQAGKPIDDQDLHFYYDASWPVHPDSLVEILKQFYGDLYPALEKSEDMWNNRNLYDQAGEWSLFLWWLVAHTSYLSCSRQLASTYAMIANLSGKTNYKKLQDPDWQDGYRPDPRVLIVSDGDAVEVTRWTRAHWEQVRSHLPLVKTPYAWPESLRSQRSLYHARLKNDPSGYYDQAWYAMVDLWRKAEIALSWPAEIYRNVARHWYTTDYAGSEFEHTSYGFAHGWPRSKRDKGAACEVFSHDDLLPPTGDDTTPGTQQWLLAWYKNMCDVHPIAWLDEKTDHISAQAQSDWLDCFGAMFTIGGLHQPSWSYFLLQTVRKQLQAWRVLKSIKPDPETGVAEVERLHGAAWPTTGELHRIVSCLDRAIPCSWQTGSDYLNQVFSCLRQRWKDMASSGADPSHLGWAKDENGAALQFWWRDRSNADQRPMPLLPETIAMLLEVWVAAAIRADKLQQPIRSADGNYKASELLAHLKKNNCLLDAQPRGVPVNEAYGLPVYLDSKEIEEDQDFGKAYYDTHRDQIRAAWIELREQSLDGLLIEQFGLSPSKQDAGESEAVVQNWINGLFDETLNDDLQLQKPPPLTDTAIQPMPGLAKPTLGASLWQPGAKVQYSYQLRGMTSFRASGNDQLSEESDLSGSPSVELDEITAGSGLAVLIPRDELLLARQFLLYRTITPVGGQPTKVWIGSGHFDPGQLDDAIFHDGNPPIPAPLSMVNVLVDSTTKPPKGLTNWVAGNKVQYTLQYLDAAGRGNLSAASPLSDPIEIHNPACGFKLTIPSDPLGIATDVQVQRQILDPNGAVITKLTVIAKHSFPVVDHPDQKYVTIYDADASPPPGKVVVSLRMTTRGLELWRSDRSAPIWTSYAAATPAEKLTSCRMQGDGNLVIYDKDLRAHWASDTMESSGKSDSQRAVMLRANGELAIVDQIRSCHIIKPLNPADTALPADGPDVFLRNGEMMLLNQVLSPDGQSP